MTCKICGSAVEEVFEYAALPRVTSDCKPWPAGGQLTVCTSCGAVQKVADAKWQTEADAIYREYEIYHQSAGIEQGVFDPATGASSPRSLKLAEFLDTTCALSAKGSILDVGCGSGVTLAAFSKVKKQWALYGYDLDERRLDRLQALPNFQQLYTGDTADIPGQYWIVSLIHATEHIPEPLPALRALLPRLGADGRLLIQVPNYCANPFDLVVADHVLHFSLETLVQLIEAAGFHIEFASDELIPKELTLTARSTGDDAYTLAPTAVATIRQRVTAQVRWLQQVIRAAEQVAAAGPLGIFGTSIAGAWMWGAQADKIEFFVDEDPSRVGREFFGKPVYSVNDIPKGAQVYIPLAPVVAQNIKQRYADRRMAFHLPPAATF